MTLHPGIDIAILVTAVLVIAYSYVVYPLLVRARARGKSLDLAAFSAQDDLPLVKVMIAAHNEEKVIAKKLSSILASSYPSEKIQIHLGLDACTDDTQSIIESQFDLPNIHFTAYPERQGKKGVLNQIAARCVEDGESILVLTDADVILRRDTIFELMRYFKDEQMGLVDSNILPEEAGNDIEATYWGYENGIKLDESTAYGTILAPSGGCFAMRSKLFTPIPANFLLDDFFLGFSVVDKGFKTVLNAQAICYEHMPTSWKQEYLRRVRIAAGNYQILWHFKRYLLRPFSKVGFIFISHKVLRWITPFLLLAGYCVLLFNFPAIVLTATVALPTIDFLLWKFGIDFKPIRRFHYFILMNIAGFAGFLKFCTGVRTTVWQPTARV